jgi:hypothetical protein
MVTQSQAYKNVRTGLSADEARAFKHWCVENDTSAAAVVTGYIRSLLHRAVKNKTQANQAQSNHLEELSDTPIDKIS